jgi:O-antigen/teichoic acid export membrane protein
VVAATAIAGVAGYVVTWLVPRSIGVVDYSVFAVFWSFTFLLIAALSGIQQELTRSTAPAESPRGDRRHGLVLFTAIASIVTFGLVFGTAWLWAAAAFPGESWGLVWPLAVSATSYVAVAAMSGTLYGLQFWTAIFSMTVIDALLRLASVTLVLMVGGGAIALAWAVAIPFILTPTIIWLFTRKRVAGRTVLDASYARLAWNSIRTTVASTAMGVIVSGFPLVLGLTSQSVPRGEFGLVALASTLTRAPLIVVGLALQSYLIVFYRNHASRMLRYVLMLLALVVVAGFALAVVGWWAGPPLWHLLFPGELTPTRVFIATLVISAALVGAMCVTAPAVLAQGGHWAYTAGWVVSACLTIGCLMLPAPFISRVSLALVLSPMFGLLVHCVYFALARFRKRLGRPLSTLKYE